MENDFIWASDEYQQNINPIKQYVEQGAQFLSVQRGISINEANEAIRDILRDREFSKFSDPSVVYFERNDNWVRELKTGTLSGYLRSALDNREVIVPTMTTYLPADQQPSLISIFMKRNAARRGVLKHQAQVEEQRGNKELAYQLNNQQDNAKRNNNSMSGSMAAAGSIFENPTGHNTLTSITRSMSSISNALNERMIAGNRHYMNSDTAINNMTAVITTMDVEAVEECIKVYGLHVPTPQEIGQIVYKSASKYWRDVRHINIVEDYASKMTDAQRVAFAYTQDLYHLRQLNPEFMRRFIDDFAIWRQDLVIPDPIKYIKSIDPLIANYAHQVHITALKGADKDRSNWPEELQMRVAKTCMTISMAIAKYKKFIDAFLVVRTVPCSTAYINHMSRESVVLSDTDSTMFSCDDWVIWYFGELVFHDFAFAVAGSIMFVSTQLIAHAMAILSANMNVARDKLHVLAMKPEFVFPVFAQTPVAKHYFCSMSVKEGAVYKSNQYEIKGVHLKSSASPAVIVKPSQERMIATLEAVQAGKKINMLDEINRVATLERTIHDSIMKGEVTFLKKLFIKSPSSYAKGPEESNYRFHTLWNQVFGPSYSEVDAPPYVAMKFPMITESKRKMVEWLASFKDQILAERYREFLKSTNRTEIKTMYVSQDYMQAYGVPEEIRNAINVRKVILDLTVTDRMFLETLGLRPKRDTLLTEMGY